MCVSAASKHFITVSDDEDSAEVSLFQSQFLSNSTPNINQAAPGPFEVFGPHISKSMGKKSTLCSPQLRKKKLLPKAPRKKSNKSVKDVWVR